MSIETRDWADLQANYFTGTPTETSFDFYGSLFGMAWFEIIVNLYSPRVIIGPLLSLPDAM